MNYRRLRPRLQNRISPLDESARFETKTASDRAFSVSVRKLPVFVLFCVFCGTVSIFQNDEENETNPETGAPVMNFGAIAVILGAAFLLSKKH